jgi:hypothetical protein
LGEVGDSRDDTEEAMRRMRRANSEPASIDVASGDSVDRLVAFLEDCIANDARGARTLQDVTEVASRVRLLQLHRPVLVEILAVADADGSNYQQVGYLTPDGTYVGTTAPRTLCDAHDNAVNWPCAAVRSLVRRYGAQTNLEEFGGPVAT